VGCVLFATSLVLSGNDFVQMFSNSQLQPVKTGCLWSNEGNKNPFKKRRLVEPVLTPKFFSIESIVSKM
jgi:hypothetical protein